MEIAFKIIGWVFFAAGMIALFGGFCVLVYVIIADKADETRAIRRVQARRGWRAGYMERRRRRLRIARMEIESKKKRLERVKARRRGFFEPPIDTNKHEYKKEKASTPIT